MLGCLYYYLDDGEDSFKEIYGGDVFTVVNSRQFKDFISKWFDNRGSLFCEPYFFDGFFGTFSDDTYFPRADNADDGDGWNTRWTWAKEGITLITEEECGYGDWRGQIFIDVSIEEYFKSELKEIIELFNPNSLNKHGI